MYHIRRVDDRDERSLHMENEIGFKTAMTEAIMRTHNSGDLHEVVDDSGKRVYIVDAALLVDVREKYELDRASRRVADAAKKPVAIPLLTFLSLAWLTAMLIHVALNR